MNWSTYEESQNAQNMTKSYLCIHLPSFFTKKTYLDPSLWFTIFWESHKCHELLQTLTVTHKHRMQIYDMSQDLFMKVTSRHFPRWLQNPKLRTRVHKQPFSSVCERYGFRKTKTSWRWTYLCLILSSWRGSSL